MEPIYLEPDEEITSVIDKLSASSGGRVAIVVPKNSTLFQSLVNLKLLAKQAKELGKDVAIISSNKVGARLATQVGLQTYATLGTLKDSPKIDTAPAAAPAPQASVAEETLPDGTPVHRYVGPVPGSAPTEEELPSSPDPVAEEAPMEPVEAAPPPVKPIAVEKETIKGEPVVVSAAPETPPPDDQPAPQEPVASSKATEDLPAIVSRTPAIRERNEFHMPWKSLIAAAVLLLIAFTGVYILLPKATVTVTLPATAVSQTLTLAAKTTIDAEPTTIPGNLLAVEKELKRAVNATGKKNIGTKASGSPSFRNCEDTNPHSIAAGTKVTASGKTFTTNAAATIPAGSFSGGGSVCNSTAVAIGVTATEAGEAYNLSGATFTIAGLSSRISGSGSVSGGTTKQVTVLSQEDLDKAFAEMEKQIVDEASVEIKTKAEGQTLLEGATVVTVKQKTADKKVGDETASATATVKSEVRAIVFDKAVANQKLTAALEGELEANQQLVIPEENKDPAMTVKGYSDDKSALLFETGLSGFGVPKVSKNEIAGAIRHKTAEQAEAILKQNYEAKEAAVTLSPSWWFGRLPILAQAISVEYGFDETPEENPEP